MKPLLSRRLCQGLALGLALYSMAPMAQLLADASQQYDCSYQNGDYVETVEANAAFPFDGSTGVARSITAYGSVSASVYVNTGWNSTGTGLPITFTLTGSEAITGPGVTTSNPVNYRGTMDAGPDHGTWTLGPGYVGIDGTNMNPLTEYHSKSTGNLSGGCVSLQANHTHTWTTGS